LAREIDMTWWQSIILGIVEGLTEYLPVSSTGHLLLAQRALGIASSDAADAFAICIQLGAILAVLGLYRKRIGQIILGGLGRDPDGFRLGVNLVAAFLPAVAIGLLLNEPIKKYLFAGDQFGLWPTVLAWFVGGVAILAVGWYRKWRKQEAGGGYDMLQLTWKLALVIGIAQCIAMWPGTSRSLVTIVGGILVGMNLRSAVEFSFLLGVITLSAATVYDGYKFGAVMLEEFGWLNLTLGLFFSWLSAVLAVRWMVSYLNRHGLAIFGYYRIALALVVAALILGGVLVY
jgi:undecaprenyl-diphosphatase